MPETGAPSVSSGSPLCLWKMDPMSTAKPKPPSIPIKSIVTGSLESRVLTASAAVSSRDAANYTSHTRTPVGRETDLNSLRL